MRVLFVVQGEGRGHLTQAISMEKLLRGNGHEVVEVLVGKSESRRLPGFFIRSIQNYNYAKILIRFIFQHKHINRQ